MSDSDPSGAGKIIGRRGGVARASAERRVEIAQQAAAERWAKAGARPKRSPPWLRVTPRDEQVVLTFGAVEKPMSADQAIRVANQLIEAAMACTLARGLRLGEREGISPAVALRMWYGKGMGKGKDADDA